MQIDLILKDGDWYTTTDKDNPLSLKTIQTGKLLSQKKIKKEIIFSYEFPDDTKFPKKKGRKKKIVKTIKKDVKIEDAVDEDLNDLEAHVEEVVEENEELQIQTEEEEDLKPKNQARAQKLNLSRKTQFVDDRTIGKEDRKIKPLARAIKRADAQTKYKYVKKHCSICNRDEIISEYEAKMSIPGMTYRCNRCCGGG